MREGGRTAGQRLSWTRRELLRAACSSRALHGRRERTAGFAEGKRKRFFLSSHVGGCVSRLSRARVWSCRQVLTRGVDVTPPCLLVTYSAILVEMYGAGAEDTREI